jgi:hypothetical protein
MNSDSEYLITALLRCIGALGLRMLSENFGRNGISSLGEW